MLPGWLGSSDSEPPGVTANATPSLVFYATLSNSTVLPLEHVLDFIRSCGRPLQGRRSDRGVAD